MSIEVTQDIFSFLTSRVGDEVGEDELDLRDWWSKETNFVGLTYIPGLEESWSEKLLDDWDQLIDWWEPFSNYDGVNWEDPNDIPRRVFPTKESIFKYILGDIEKWETDKFDVGCVEITHSEKLLFLIYTDFDGWNLSSDNTVLVVKSLDDLTEEKGFY